MMLDIKWCCQKDCNEFARWLTVLVIEQDAGEYSAWVCTDHRQEIIGKFADSLVELGIDFGMGVIRAEILQYDAWVKDPDRKTTALII